MRLDLLTGTPALSLIGLIALAILAIWALARRRGLGWAPTAVRILASAGLVVPGWTILTWYGELSRAREWADRLNAPASTEPIAREFLVNSAAILTLGFALLVVGISVAHLLDDADDTDSAGGSP